MNNINSKLNKYFLKVNNKIIKRRKLRREELKRKQFIKKVSILILLIIIYTYVVAIQSIPSNIVIFEGETISLKTIFGIKANLVYDNETVETISNNQNPINEVGKKTVKLNLFENIFLKNINIDVLPKTTVIPVGNIAGIKLYTSGVLVVGMSEIYGVDNKA